MTGPVVSQALGDEVGQLLPIGNRDNGSQRGCHYLSASPTHHGPVILISGSTKQTDLIVAATGINAWPGEPMCAPSAADSLPEIHDWIPCWRPFQALNQR